MSKLLTFLMAAGLWCVPTLALAQTEAAKTKTQPAGAEVSASDVAAVAAYREAQGRLSDQIRTIRKDLRDKNTALARALAKTDNYDEKEVRARYADLMTAQQKLAEIDLEGLLLYKKYNPAWKPDANGRKVGLPGGGDRSHRGDKTGKARKGGETPPDFGDDQE